MKQFVIDALAAAILLAILLPIPLAPILWFMAYGCATHGRITGRAVQFAAATCYVHTGKGWIPVGELSSPTPPQSPQHLPPDPELEP